MSNHTIYIPDYIVPQRELYGAPDREVEWMQTYTWWHVHTDTRNDCRTKTHGKDLRDAFSNELEQARRGDWQYGFQFYDVKTIWDTWHHKHSRESGRITPTFIVGTLSIRVEEVLAMSESQLWDVAKISDRPYLLLDTIKTVQEDQNSAYKEMLLCSDNVWRLICTEFWSLNDPNNQYPIIAPKEWEIEIKYT